MDNGDGRPGIPREGKLILIADVEGADGAQKKVKLPFLVGVVAPLSDKPVVDENGNRISIAKRGFTEVNRDNFGAFMKSVRPEVSVRVDNELDDSGGKIGANLVFESLEDFEPDSVARQVPALRDLLEAREKFAHLKALIDGNEPLERELLEVLKQTMEELRPLSGDKRDGEGGTP